MDIEENPSLTNHFRHALHYLAPLVLYILLGLAVYSYVIDGWIKDARIISVLFLGWILLAYLFLPLANRLLSKIYTPNYFIGRTRTGEGLLGDPVNLALYGTKEELRQVMLKSGWHEAAPLTFRTAVKIIAAVIRNKPYVTAPMSALFLFDHKQDLAFQIPDGNNPRRRHHVRFWKTPKKWWLPGGYQADWLGAATFDRNVGLSLFNGQITHKIDPYVDTERDYVIQTLQDNKFIADMTLVKNFTTEYRTRNGGGDIIYTDGALPFLTLQDKQEQA